MDELRLAQFFIITEEKVILQKVRALEKSVFSCCITDDRHHHTYKMTHYGGYNCLHFAVQNSNLDLLKKMLDEGVDILKQGTRDGKTPLHIAIGMLGYFEDQPVQLLTSEIKNLDIINTLLEMQIIRNETSNVKCNKGMTHLQIASLVNNAEAVSFFVKAGASLDEKINIGEHHCTAGYTALHFAIKYSSVDAAKILIKNSANIHAKDAKGVSPLTLLIERLLLLKDYMYMGQRVLCYAYQEEIEMLEDIAQFVFKTVQRHRVNSADGTELSTFHLACSLTDASMAREFLTDHNINLVVSKDSQSWPHWTPLHFAACSSVETFKFLLQNGACIKARDARGQTPLDFCIMRYDPEIIFSILFTKLDVKDIFLSDGVTKMLDLLLAMHNSDTLSNFLQSLPDVNARVPVDSPVWPGCNALHLALKCNEKTRSHKELLQKYQNQLDTLPEVYNCTEDDENEYLKRITVYLAKSCSINDKNADGLSPVHLAFYLRKAKVLDLLINNCRDNIADSNNVSILHMACATGRMDVAERLIKRGADIDSQTTSSFECCGKSTKPLLLLAAANSTPLHLAVVFGHDDIVKYLLRKGADVYAKNSYGLTPIHLSMANGNTGISTARLLLQLVPNLKESISNDGLTHLHVAAFADDEYSIGKLLQQGANINAVFNIKSRDLRSRNDCPTSELSLLSVCYSGTTPFYAAFQRRSGNAVLTLLQSGADFYKISERCCILRRLMIEKSSGEFNKYFLEILKRDERVVGAIDHSGITLLHIACAIQDFEWAKELLERGANVNAQMSDLYNDSSESWTADTPLHLFIDAAVVLELPLADVENFVKLLLEYGADVTIKDHNSTPLHLAYDVNRSEPIRIVLLWDGVSEELAETWTYIADLLFESQKSLDVNPIDEYGFSHFHYACLRNKVEVVKKFLENGVDINQSTDPFSGDDGGSTALHFAFEQKSEEVARLLIERGANLKAENRNGDTPLHVALENGVADLHIFESMLRKGADLHAQSIFCSRKPFDCLLYSNNITHKVLNFFLEKGSTIDIISGNGTSIGNIIKNSKPRDRQVILSKIIKVCKLRSAIKIGFNPIESIVAVNQEDELKLGYYLHSIKMFIEMGCPIDRQNGEGKTALHEAVSRYNLQAIEALLLLGANMDLVDNENEAPFTIQVFELSNRDNERETATLAILSKHTWKMKFVGLKVHQSSEEAMKATLLEMRLELDFIRRCKEELRKLQQIVLGETSTMKDFLQGSGVVNMYPILSFAQRKTIKEFFKPARRLRRNFPEFAGLLAMQNRKALQRDRLYHPSKIALANILQVRLPDLCSENLLKYFENYELLKVLDAGKY